MEAKQIKQLSSYYRIYISYFTKFSIHMWSMCYCNTRTFKSNNSGYFDSFIIVLSHHILNTYMYT